MFQKRMLSARTLVGLLAAALFIASPGAALAATTGATASVVNTAKRTPLAAKLDKCTTRNAARAATFKGAMPGVPAFRGRMEMRFELFQRSAPKAPWTQVFGVDSFDEWDLSDPGVSAFIVKKKVFSLSAGYAYRARVSYRWRDAGNRIRRTLRRLTPACEQPGTVPDLALASPSITLGGREDAVAYKVTVRNGGTGGTGTPFSVTLTVNDTTQPPQVVGPLAPGQSTEVTFQAPRCTPGSRVRFVADAVGVVYEGDESNNVLERTCRAAGG